MLVGVLAVVSMALLAYEIHTLTLAVIWPLLQNPGVLQTDFHYYFDAARRFAFDSSRLYNPEDDFIAGFAYPPLAILPFLALSGLPLGAGLLCLTIASYAAVLFAVRMWCAHLRENGVALDGTTMAAVTLVALGLGPTYSNAIFGQVNALVLLSGVAFLRLGRQRPILGGALLAIGMWLKIYPVLLIATGAWNRRAWKAIACAAAAAVLLMVIALPIVPLTAHRTFLREVVPARIDKTAIHISNQSLVAFVERFRVPPSGYLQWTGEQAITVSAPVRVLNAGFGLLVLVLLWRQVRLRSLRVDSEATLLALVAIVAPLGWGHTYILVLPLVILRVAEMPHLDRARAFLIFGSVVALMIPAGRVFEFANNWPHLLQNLLYSRYLLATAVLALVTQKRARPA